MQKAEVIEMGFGGIENAKKSRRRKVALAVALLVAIVACGAGAVYRNRNREDASKHNQSVEQVHSKLDPAKHLNHVNLADLDLNHVIARIDAYRRSLDQVKKDARDSSLKYADGTDRNWDKLKRGTKTSWVAPCSPFEGANR